MTVDMVSLFQANYAEVIYSDTDNTYILQINRDVNLGHLKVCIGSRFGSVYVTIKNKI